METGALNRTSVERAFHDALICQRGDGRVEGSEGECWGVTRAQGVKKKSSPCIYLSHTSLTVEQGTQIDESGAFENLLLLSLAAQHSSLVH